MKVTKSAIHRLEVEITCGCKAAGEYEDDICKKARGVASFIPCALHATLPADMTAMFGSVLIETLEKEAKEQKAPEVAPAVHPRTQALQVESGSEDTAGAPARTMRTTGSSERPPAASPGPRSVPGSHRPTGGGGSGRSMVRRADPALGLSANAASRLGGRAKVASGGNSSGITFAGSVSAMDNDMDPVPEDHRVTALLENSGALDGEEGGIDMEDIEF